jgi:hypothetical protein
MFTTDLSYINKNDRMQIVKPAMCTDRMYSWVILFLSSLLDSGEFFGEESFHVKEVGFRIKLR